MRERLYNPAHLTREELKASFIVRQNELAELLRMVHDQPKEGPLQHVLIIGARGMGKTSLGLRLLLAVDEDLVLRTQWQPVAFFEESYGVHDLASLWLTALQHLAEAVKDKRWSRRADALREQERDPQRLAALALGALAEFRQESGRRPILLVENLDEILRQMGDRGDISRLRATLQEGSDLLLIGTANGDFLAISGHDEPFYEFFRLLRLRGLGEQETLALVKGLSKQAEYSNLQAILSGGRKRIEIIRSLTGGNPRLILLAARMMAEAPTGEARQDLERLIDEQTPYFKSRIESLPPQARVVFHALAAGWAPMLAREVAAQSRLSSSHASAQLKGLVSMGYVEEVRQPRERRVRYQVLERFYNVYYLLRFTHDQRRRLERLIDFLVALFEVGSLRSMAKATLQRIGAGLGRSDDWMMLGVILPRVAKDFDAAVSSELFRETLHICTLHGVQVPELLRHGDEYLDDDAAYRAEYIASSRSSLQANPNDILIWLGLVKALLANKDVLGTADALKSAVQCVPEHSRLWALLGKVLAFAGEGNAAANAYRRAIEVDSAKSEYWLELGRQLATMEQLEEAQQALTKAVELDPKSAPARACLGEVLAARGQTNEAEVAFKAALDVDPTSTGYWSSLGSLLLEAGRDSEGADALQHSIELDAQNRTGLLKLGFLRCKQNRFEESETLLRRLIGLDPQNSLAWLHLAFCLSLDQRVAEANEAIAVVLSVAGANAHVVLGAGALQLLVGDSNEAIRTLSAAKQTIAAFDMNLLKEPLTGGFCRALAQGSAEQLLELLSEEPLREHFEPLLHAAREQLGEPLPPLPAEMLHAVEQVRALVSRLRGDGASLVATTASRHFKRDDPSV